jgi:ketosteroid isomerase-like protein
MGSQSDSDVADLIRRCYATYETRDRQTLEGLLSDDFTFSSPRDDHISKTRYFERCWPFSEHVRSFRIEKLFVQSDEAFVLYECTPVEGKPFRNTEFFKTADGKVTAVEVYFGSPSDDVSPA